MRQLHRTRRRFAALVSGMAILATALAGCSSSGSPHPSPRPTSHTAAAAAAPVAYAPAPSRSANTMPSGLSAKALALHDAMRALWEIHGQYTERAIVDAVSGNPDTNAVVARLQQNQVDIGNAVKPYYGTAAGDALTNLLHQHISTAVATVLAAKSGNTAATHKAVVAFDANGKRIASFLHSANPANWSEAAMRNMMTVHLSQVVNLALDQIKGQYAAGIQLYNAYIDHILIGMADMLSDGIMKQFPTQFS